jgi:uncharacterized protein YjbJ (UPF0337 family)
MRTLPWIIAGAGVVGAAYVLYKTPGPESPTGSDTLENVARSTSRWGSKKRIKGTGLTVVGKVKEEIADLTQSDQLASEGVLDQAAGAIHNSAGKFAQAAGQTLHDLND